jgi:hypothetical protein
MKNIWFYWDGDIPESRLRILKDCVYSTKYFNPHHTINLVSNTIELEGINNIRWDDSFFEGVPIDREKIEYYKTVSPRDFSDLFRLVLLYKFGGTYIDTDDLCIAPISETKNIVCRSYDPHTSFYNKIKDEDCVPGYTRELSGYDHIPMFPRNDCWQNWEKNHPFIYDVLTNENFKDKDFIWIGGEHSWQSITNQTCKKWIDRHGIDWNFRLTLVYFFEDFVAWSSFWDRCHHGGEFCDIWQNLPEVNEYKWGEYKCVKEVGLSLYKKIKKTYPSVSHLWLHSKDMNPEWLNEINETEKYSPSTWILNEIRKICYQY